MAFKKLPTSKLKILVISKPFDEKCTEYFLQVLQFLAKQGVPTYTNKACLETIKDEYTLNEDQKPKIYSSEVKINRIVTLGGDGTILYAIKMFYSQDVPPILSFAQGSVGYLWAFDCENIEDTLTDALLSSK